MSFKQDYEIRERLVVLSKHFRHRLADENALLPLSALGILTGLLSGLVIQFFRFMIEAPADMWMPGGHENFEELAPELRFAIVVYGALSLGLVLQFLIKNVPSMGVGHVVQRLNQHHGRLPLRPTILQFMLGVWCILTGQSTGREGPAVHLGAGVSSFTGQYWRLPNNSIRVLTGCGTAAAIAASFNTPIAGVIFAMEVVMMEYTIAGFIPIMLAASAGTIISYLVYGTAPAFLPPILEVHQVIEVPGYILLGFLTGIAAALFCFLHKSSLKLLNVPVWIRFTLAGLLTGALAWFVPEIMGIGYDTLDLALESQLGLYLMLGIALAKIITSAFSSGVGMPIGIIAPSLLAGGCLGGAIGILINFIAPNTIANDSLYVMLGMGAMMGAVLNAPLAALIALLELTNTPDIILPGLIAIVVATLTNTQIFGQRPPHIETLSLTGKSSRLSIFDSALQRIGVTSLMNTHVILTNRIIPKSRLMELIQQQPRWIVIEDPNLALMLINGHQLEAGYNESEELHALSEDKDIDLSGLPGDQIKTASLHFQASALEAWQLMEETDCDAIFITGAFDNYAPAISGIITRNDIEDYYHRPRLS